MEEEQVLKLMADVGPNAGKALEAWVSLQWAEFYLAASLTVALMILLGWIFWRISSDD